MNIINERLPFTHTLTRRKTTRRVLLHHAAAKTASVETIHKWHLDRGWAGIGYNFYIRKDGRVYQGRGWDCVGAHCSGYNADSIGICFEGSYETETDMPAAQYNAGVALIAEALRRYPSITEICGHRTHGATACPGRNFPLARMITDGRGRKEEIAADTAPVPEPSKKETVRSLQEALNLDGLRDAQGRPLTVDGIKGTNTSAAIEKTLCKAGAPAKGRYQVGSRGAVVQWVQQRLNAQMGRDLAEDGKYGHDTREAVWDWQESRGLTRDGKAGPDTITSLL